METSSPRRSPQSLRSQAKAIARAQTFPQDVVPWERSAPLLLPPRDLGRVISPARTYPGPGDDHPIRMMSALCAAA